MARTLRSALRTQHELALENLVLRQQVAALKFRYPRPRLTDADQLLGPPPVSVPQPVQIEAAGADEQRQAMLYIRRPPIQNDWIGHNKKIQVLP